MFVLEKGRLQGDVTVVFKYLKECCVKGGSELFPGDGQETRDLNYKEPKKRENILSLAIIMCITIGSNNISNISHDNNERVHYLI